jgi:predicted NBD/HSP70 family sugar kinase
LNESDRDGEVARGQVALAHNLPGWGRQGLVEALRLELGTNVGFENDVNLATIGEGWKGIGKDVANFVYVHVGTGVGMGLVLGGRLHRGSVGAAGEIGYLPLAAADPHDPSNRRRGALESAIGAAGVVATARRLGMRPPLTPKKVFTAARRGDPTAERVVEAVAGGIALAIAAVVPVVDPELVVLGGGIGRNGDLLLATVERELRAISPFSPRVEASPLGDEATVLGAIGILVYAQSYGFLQLYTAPLYMAFPAMAAILIGGASLQKASIAHVLIGTALFHTLLTIVSPTIASSLTTNTCSGWSSGWAPGPSGAPPARSPGSSLR